MASAEEQEISDKVKALCIARYGDSTDAHMRQLFMSYDENGNGTLNAAELTRLLDDADVGWWYAPQSMVVSKVFEALDKDPQDGELTWEEYKRVPKAPPPPPGPLANYDGPMTPYGQLPAGCDATTGICLASASGDPKTVGGALSASSGGAGALKRSAMVAGLGAVGWMLGGPLGGILGAVAASRFSE